MKAAATAMGVGAVFVLAACRIATAQTAEPAAAPPAFQIIARMSYSLADYRSDRRDLGSDHLPTSLRLGASGVVADHYAYMLQYELSAWFRDTGRESRLRYATLSRRWDNGMGVDIGQTDEAFGMEALTSTKNTTFMSRALPFALVPVYHLGAKWSLHKAQGGVALGLFGQAIGQNNHDAGHGLSARGYFSPIGTPRTTLHLGGSISLRTTTSGVVRYRTKPESAVTDVRLVDTGSITGATRTRALGLEGAWAFDAFALQSEVLSKRVERDAGLPEPRFSGRYLMASYMLTGERKAFNSGQGLFAAVKPSSKYGAVEVALRYSAIDLADKTIAGGKQNDITLGVNWYVSSKVRLMFNAISVRSERRGISDNPKIFQAMLQVDL